MPTANFNLPLYTTSDTAALDTLLNGQSNALDAALLASEGRIAGTDAARTAMTAPRRKEGLEFRATDTDREWKYDGSNWLSNDMGAYLIIPTSATGAGCSIATDGTVLFSSVTSNTIAGANGIFSTRFRNYMIKFRITGTSISSLNGYFAVAGTPQQSVGTYQGTRYFMSGGATTTVTDASTNATVFSSVSANEYTGDLSIFDPANASAASGILGNVAGAHLMGGTTYRRLSNVAEDGFHLQGVGAAWSGWAKFYGMA